MSWSNETSNCSYCTICLFFDCGLGFNVRELRLWLISVLGKSVLRLLSLWVLSDLLSKVNWSSERSLMNSEPFFLWNFSMIPDFWSWHCEQSLLHISKFEFDMSRFSIDSFNPHIFLSSWPFNDSSSSSLDLSPLWISLTYYC